MKKQKIFIYLLASCLLLCSCKKELAENDSAGDALLEIAERVQQNETSSKETESFSKETETASEVAEDPVSEDGGYLLENLVPPSDTTALGCDYSPYSALLKAYELDYNVSYTAGNDYEVVGMNVHENDDSGFYNVSGFFYADLIDFDNNGVLELVLAAASEEDMNNLAYGETPYDDFKYSYIVKIYTIDEDGLRFLGSSPLSYLLVHGTDTWGIEYITSDNKTYFNHSIPYRVGYGEERYYGLTDGFWDVEVLFESTHDAKPWIDGQQYTAEEFYDIKKGYGESVVYDFTYIDADQIERIKNTNKKTFEFLADYPIKNFSNGTGAYNDGSFYFMEYSAQFADFSILPVYDYFEALTVKDYDMLSSIYSNSEHENLKYFKYVFDKGDDGVFIPGYIIQDIQPITPEEIEHPDLAKDLSNMLNEVPEGKDSYLIKVVVNEVLDPHVSALGMQVAGGIVDMYFIVSSDDSDGYVWEIEDILDNKFYW